MRGGFRWDVGGVGSARRRDMKVRPHRTKNCGSFAILGMRRVAVDCLGSGSGIQSALRLEPWETRRMEPRGAFTFATYANASIARRGVGLWSLMRSRRGGSDGIAMTACSGWRSVFCRRSWRRRESGRRLVRSRVQLPGFAGRTAEGGCPHIWDYIWNFNE